MAQTLLTPPFVRGHDHALGEAGPALVVFGDYEDPDSAAAHRDVMALRERWDGFTYAWRHLPLSTVAGKTRTMEDVFINEAGTDVTDAFRLYLRPLLGSGMPDAYRLRPNPVPKVLNRG